MMTTRKRILPAGWYPASEKECADQIDEFLTGFKPPEGDWIGGVAPHAGWYFSGRAAARVVSALAQASPVDRVVLYGGHLPGGERAIVYGEDAWETPFGPLSMDSAFARDLAESGAAATAPVHFSDNTVEVQLPFVKRFFPHAELIAAHAPSSDDAMRLGEAVQRMLSEKGLSAVYLGSADLTHYGPNYGFAPQGVGEGALRWVKNENDKSLIDNALAMNAGGVIADGRSKHNTCSAGAVAAVIASAARHGITAGHLLEYYTSYDVMPNSSFVGYAAIVY